MFPKRLRLEVIVLLGLKALLLTVIYYALVAPGEKPEPGSFAMQSHLLDRP